jgi:hypothetical protein
MRNIIRAFRPMEDFSMFKLFYEPNSSHVEVWHVDTNGQRNLRSWPTTAS